MAKIILFHDPITGFIALTEEGKRMYWATSNTGFSQAKADIAKSFPDDEIFQPKEGDQSLISAIEKYRDIRVKDHSENPFDFNGILRRATGIQY